MFFPFLPTKVSACAYATFRPLISPAYLSPFFLQSIATRAVSHCKALADYSPTPWHLHLDIHGTLATVVPNLLRMTFAPTHKPSRRQLLKLRDGGTIALDWADGTEG